MSVRLPFVSQYASHLYRSTSGKILVVVVTGMLFPIMAYQGFSASHDVISASQIKVGEGFFSLVRVFPYPFAGIPFGPFLSAAPQQSEICVKFSVFHTVFEMKFW